MGAIIFYCTTPSRHIRPFHRTNKIDKIQESTCFSTVYKHPRDLNTRLFVLWIQCSVWCRVYLSSIRPVLCGLLSLELKSFQINTSDLTHRFRKKYKLHLSMYTFWIELVINGCVGGHALCQKHITYMQLMHLQYIENIYLDIS